MIPMKPVERRKMGKEKLRQDNQDRDWQRVDARILGQILAAQNFLFLLPHEKRIAEFFSEALSKIPGVASCLVCLGGPPEPSGTMNDLCTECMARRKKKEGIDGLPPGYICLLAAGEELDVIPMSTADSTFGFFLLKIDSRDIFMLYQPFLNNLANFLTLSLENRMQKRLLINARDELEGEVKKRTKELEEMNERFSLAVRAAHMGVWDWNIPKNELVWDDRMYELYGVNREDFSGAYETWLNGIHPDDRAYSNEISEQARRDERDYDTEFRVVWPDRSVHYLKAYGQFVRDREGKPVRMTGINYDITDWKRAEEKIRQLNQELEQRVIDRTIQLERTNRELEAFAYSVSHDLRAPLRHISGFLKLLQKKTDGVHDENNRHYIEAILKSVHQMDQLINDLLSFSRMVRNEITRKKVDMEELVREVIRESKPEIQDRSVNWQIDTLPTVTGDRAMLRLVLVNLISNALKFTRVRQQAEIEIGSLNDTDNETVFFVRDNGVGFDNTYADKLFGVFQRLHRSDEFEGTGIGLANVRRIIHRHGGRTWAESIPNQGATFYFSLLQT